MARRLLCFLGNLKISKLAWRLILDFWTPEKAEISGTKFSSLHFLDRRRRIYHAYLQNVSTAFLAPLMVILKQVKNAGIRSVESFFRGEFRVISEVF